MEPLTFNQQLTLILVDKLAIGAVIVIVVFVGQWILEAYKGRQALWTEISKERVKHIACEWNEMNKWDAIVGELYFRLRKILEGQLGDQSEGKAQATIARPELSETIAFLSRLNPKDIPAGLTAQCKQKLSPLIAESLRQSAAVNRALQANRFWLGKELYEHCRRFQGALANICVSFGTMDFKKLADQAKELDFVREDVLTTIKELK